MSDFPETHSSLLVQLRSDGDRLAWDRFVLLYRPVIYRLARARGLQDADAQDLSQQVLIAVAAAIGDWEPAGESVRFRHWLRRVAHNAILNALLRRPHDRGIGGTTVQELLAELPELDHESAAEIEVEYRRELYLRAARIVRTDVEADTWRAFEMTVVENQSIDQAAAELGKSVGTIYAARSRVMRRLRQAVEELENLET